MERRRSPGKEYFHVQMQPKNAFESISYGWRKMLEKLWVSWTLALL
jgi:hypothetical protein